MTEICEGKGYFYFKRKIWGKTKTVKIMAESRSDAEKNLAKIIRKIDRIERGRMKISQKIAEDFSVVNPISETPEEFYASLYISDIYAEIYRNGDIVIIFTVKSSRKYVTDFFYECVLHEDNSFEI